MGMARKTKLYIPVSRNPFPVSQNLFRNQISITYGLNTTDQDEGVICRLGLKHLPCHQKTHNPGHCPFAFWNDVQWRKVGNVCSPHWAPGRETKPSLGG